jgi:hypothetical protein
MEVSYLKLD